MASPALARPLASSHVSRRRHPPAATTPGRFTPKLWRRRIWHPSGYRQLHPPRHEQTPADRQHPSEHKHATSDTSTEHRQRNPPEQQHRRPDTPRQHPPGSASVRKYHDAPQYSRHPASRNNHAPAKHDAPHNTCTQPEYHAPADSYPVKFKPDNNTPGNADYYPGTFYHKAEHAPDSEKLFQTDDQHPVYL